jgi:glycolate oxidase FAD binding subunit
VARKIKGRCQKIAAKGKVMKTDWQAALEQIVGAENLRRNGDWFRDRHWAGPVPQVVVFPSDREQTQEIVLLAGRDQLRLAAVGQASRQQMGGAQQPLDFVVSLARMDRVTDFPASDLTISVEAGVPLRKLKEVLAGHGQMLPLEIPFAQTATIGGTIAANANGPRRLGYGAWRDIVLGVEFLTADGMCAKGGGRVVKNVAGYDIPKLLVGSFGTLGVIVEITLRTFPIPPASVTLALGFSTLAHALQAAQRILQSQFQPQAMQFVEASQAEFAHLPLMPSGACHLIVEIAGQAVVVERCRSELPVLAGRDGMDGVAFLEGEQEDRLRDALVEFTPNFLRSLPEAWLQGWVVKASLPLNQMEIYCERARKQLDSASLRGATIAQAGTGIIHLHIWGVDRGKTSVVEVTDTVKELVQLAEQLGGHGLIEWCPEESKGEVNLWGTTGNDLPWMRAIKEEWDPAGILNPGRFYGGI